MDEKRLLREIEDDLRIARGAKLIYVEGTKDVTALFALLGLQAPRQSPGGGAPHGGGYVKAAGGRDRGGGKQYVRDLVDAARLRGYPDVFGILDGDGQPLAKLDPLVTLLRQKIGSIKIIAHLYAHNYIALIGSQSTVRSPLLKGS